MTTTERLRELERAATAGPWASTPNPMRSDGKFLTHAPERSYDPPNSHLMQLPEGIFMGQGKPKDVDFLAATRNALPAMLAVIEAAEAYATACDQSVGEKLMRLQSALAAFREVRE